MMIILHILNEIKRSGAETMLRNASTNFINENFRHYILSTGDDIGEYAHELEQCGYVVLHLPFRKSLTFYREFISLVRAHEIDLIHVHTERGSLGYAFAARIAAISCVRTVHNTFLFSGMLRLRRILTRALTRLSGAVQVGCSFIVAENERTRFHNTIPCVENWIDTTKFARTSPALRDSARSKLNLRPHEIALLTVGNCLKTKNHDFLIQTLRCLPNHYILLHCGSGELEPCERALAETVGVAHRVRFIGSTPAVDLYLAAADIFVMSSHIEGGSIALLEALATGLPCVTTRVGMASQLDVLSNLKIAPLDERAYAVAVEEFASMHPNSLEGASTYASEFVHLNYSPERGAKDYTSIYMKLLKPELVG